MGPPGAEHADHVAPADVDQVLGQEMGGQVVLDAPGALVAAKEGYVAGLAEGREAAVEAHHVVVGVTRGGRQEADARPRGIQQRQDVVVQQRSVFLHREPAASKGDDLGSS